MTPVPGHWSQAFYGELYADSVAGLLGPRLTAVEVDVITRLLELAPRDRVLDLACGEGRHARPLAGRVGSVVGLDRNAEYLARANAGRKAWGPRFVRADVRALPFRAGAFDAALSWYGSLFMFSDTVHADCLADLARVLRPGGRLLVHHGNPLALARQPVARTSRTLEDGSRVEEVSSFDPVTGVDRSRRVLTRPSGRVLEGTSELRYYTPSEWGPLAERAGLRLLQLTSTTGAGTNPRRELGPEAPDLIALLEKT